MNFNDIGRRLERVNYSIGQLKSEDYQKYIVWHPDGSSISFTREDDISDEHAILSVISGIADLKDNLKNKMVALGKDPKLVEDTINQNVHLQLITDLDNQQKHGYPLTKSRRSKMDPEIKKIYSAPSFTMLKGGENSIVKLDLENQKITSEGMKNELIIGAEICDYGGNFICSLDSMIEGAMGEWVNFINQNGLNNSIT